MTCRADHPAADHPDAVRTARRRLATVLVEGLGTTGIRIAEQLIELGIGTVLLRDERPITASDPAYRRADRGRPRADVACRMLQRPDSRSAVLEAPEDSALIGLDLRLVVADGEPAWARLRAADQGETAVLPVELSASGFCIGPMLAAGSGLCPQCLVLHGLAEDPEAGDERGSRAIAPATTSTIAAGIAAHQVQVLIDGDSAAAVQSGALLGRTATGRIDHRSVSPHPECRCLTYLRADRSRAGVRRRRQRPHITSGEALVTGS